MHPPILSRSGYVLTSRELGIFQPEGWLTLPLSEIAEVKMPSLNQAVLRLTNRRKKTLDLSHLSTKGFAEVTQALKASVHGKRVLASQLRKKKDGS